MSVLPRLPACEICDSLRAPRVVENPMRVSPGLLVEAAKNGCHTCQAVESAIRLRLPGSLDDVHVNISLGWIPVYDYGSQLVVYIGANSDPKPCFELFTLPGMFSTFQINAFVLFSTCHKVI